MITEKISKILEIPYSSTIFESISTNQSKNFSKEEKLKLNWEKVDRKAQGYQQSKFKYFDN